MRKIPENTIKNQEKVPISLSSHNNNCIFAAELQDTDYAL
jgi:hypothetical protein